MPRAGVQPLRAVLVAQRYTTRQAADAIGVDWVHLGGTIKGHIRPCQVIRDRLPELLGVPLEDLYTPDMLVLPYMGDLGIGKAMQRRKPVSS